MTAFASHTGSSGATSWIWELRGLNARGLDLRLRIPDELDGVEATVRTVLKQHLHRGSVSLALRLSHEDKATAMVMNSMQIDSILKALNTVQERAKSMGVTLAQPNAADVLSQRGVMIQDKTNYVNIDLIDALKQSFELLVADFIAMRQTEGEALKTVVNDQLHQIKTLVAQAASVAEERKPFVAKQLSNAMQSVLNNVADVEPARIAQELAMLAVKSDVTEEIDRLGAHVNAARALLDDRKPAGRKLDFLTQEFNREANTLCSKAGASGLTAIGLELKAVIDQMREQIQNVE